MDWVLPTAENLAVAEAATSEERNVAPPRAADHSDEHGLISQPKKLAMHFKLIF
jgi:hypothetical protein